MSQVIVLILANCDAVQYVGVAVGHILIIKLYGKLRRRTIQGQNAPLAVQERN